MKNMKYDEREVQSIITERNYNPTNLIKLDNELELYNRETSKHIGKIILKEGGPIFTAEKCNLDFGVLLEIGIIMSRISKTISYF